jgi:hypothetical protein
MNGISSEGNKAVHGYEGHVEVIYKLSTTAPPPLLFIVPP